MPSLPTDSVAAWAGGAHKRVLAVGMLKTPKDFPLLIRAFSLLRAQVDARLLILGEGTERARLEKLVHELGLQGMVMLPGYVADTAPFYAQSDLFVLSSDHEGFGNVIVEALEQGCPVVSTDCPSGPREILTDGRCGRLVPVGDVAALAAAMQESLASAHDHDALRARAQDFSVSRISDQYLDLLLPGWREGRTA
ncbi:glycosyltransferase [Pseudoxanthomonas sp. NC8]|nr:glycosyltransferase [Pseudoxanthomonas sp. NC8]